ncbi:MAG: YicC/YloC family endoribonuclease [Bacteroidota bacterium]|nr:YicC/YloC family endoribonuclease [Bacteroidota bacterium]
MILSMTGYGKAETNTHNKKFTVEIKSLNSKQIDMNVRVPGSFRDKELKIRKLLSTALSRGKIDCSLFVEYSGTEKTANINAEVVKKYYHELQIIAKELDNNDELMSTVMRMPEVMKLEKEEINPHEWETIESLIHQASNALIQFRKDEGQSLAQDFKLRIENIRGLMLKIEKEEHQRVANIKERIVEKLGELKSDIDEIRMEQELIYFLEKLDVTEEIIRLSNHLNYFLETMNSDISEGKKLGFICQEIGREINTIGSKSNNAEMQQQVVQMKDELEKIKEQIFNVL